MAASAEGDSAGIPPKMTLDTTATREVFGMQFTPSISGLAGTPGMSGDAILVTGTPGNVGTQLVETLRPAETPVKVPSTIPPGPARPQDGDGSLEVVGFGFTDPAT
jgi:hypothetical protein